MQMFIFKDDIGKQNNFGMVSYLSTTGGCLFRKRGLFVSSSTRHSFNKIVRKKQGTNLLFSGRINHQTRIYGSPKTINKKLVMMSGKHLVGMICPLLPPPAVTISRLYFRHKTEITSCLIEGWRWDNYKLYDIKSSSPFFGEGSSA